MDLLERIKQVILEVINDKSKINDFGINKEQVYAFTNENIAGYMGQIKIPNSNAKALSVCSGGDHLLNLGVKNYLNVDLVDVNPMTEYFTLGIKVPLVLSYSYEEFKQVIDFLFKSNDYDLDKERRILYNLLPLMNLKYKLFFKEIFDCYFRLQEKFHVPIKLLQILTTDYYFNLEEITFYNLYLQQEDNYNKLRQALKKMHLSFQKDSIFDINVSDEYDLVLCSNALEHTYIPDCDIAKLRNFYNKLRSSLNKDGMICATYLYGFYDKASDSYENSPVKGTDISIREILTQELIVIDSYKNAKDAVLVLKK